MKKNKAMRLASALLVLTLLTTCAISGTFAKYVTSTEGTDNARVAYWGFDQGATTTIDLFNEAYTNTSTDPSVKSSGEVDGFKNVIAPGTSKTATFAFGYTNYKGNKINAPEVAYTFTVKPTITGSYTALDANENFKWTLQKGDEAIAKYDTVAELLAAIKLLSGDGSGSKTYQPGELPVAFTSADEVYTIGWTWDFNGAAGDGKDTAMGNSQALDNVTFTIAISATQVD